MYTHHKTDVSNMGISPADVSGPARGTALSLEQFWRMRNVGSHLTLDRLTVHNVSIFAAYAAYRAGMTPNHVSLLSGLFSVCVIAATALTPAGDAVFSVLVIWGLAQFAYLLDCADGQLARITNNTSELGAFLDKSMDISGAMLQFGAFSIFAYRHYAGLGDATMAHLFLYAGLIFIFFKVSRFAVWQFFVHMLPEAYESSKARSSLASEILKNLADHQVSLANMLVFLISPTACLAIFMIQTILIASAWARYFRRAAKST